MNIRHRITLLIVLTFLAISAIGGYAVLQSRRSAAEVKAVTEGVVPSALATADLVAQLKEVQLTAIAIVSSPDGQLAAQTNEKLASKKAILLAATGQQQQRATSDAQRGLAIQAKESLDNYFAAIDDVVKNKLAGRADIAQASYYGNVVQYQDELEAIVETLRIEKNRSKDSAIAAVNENQATTATAITGVTIFAVVFLTLIGALLYRQITGPISRMQTMMSGIAASQDFTRRVPVDRNDEIGRSIVAFNGMIEKIEENAALLKQKSADIQTMLQNIPQGILTIVQGNTVHPEYSAHLETLLETADIAGRPLMSLIFSGTTLGADTLSQLEVASAACIGEDVMNFTFNEHLMVGEIEKTMADGRVKIIDLSWSPICDDNGVTVRMMLCLRDVTELRALALEANEQKHELEIIGEILALPQKKFLGFLNGSLAFIAENERIIEQNPAASGFAVARLFRNMHTIKGNSRTYGLLHLANLVHEAEQSYDDLRQIPPLLAWNRQQLMTELAGVKALLERYGRINADKLGRSGTGDDSAALYLTIDRKQMQDSLHRLETVNTANLHELVAVRDAVRKTLRLLGTESLGAALSGVLASVPALADELGKQPPRIEIEDRGYAVHGHDGAMLQNVFMHLIRNAMDHGIETAAERDSQGKRSPGTLRLAMEMDDAMLHITLGDDGRGLALARIRAIAADKGLCGADARLSDDEVARFIFSAGFSTAEHVTDVSGRGVGMDAVRDFIERENGTIAIRFTDEADGAAFRQFIVVVSLPARFGVDTGPLDDHAGDRHAAVLASVGLPAGGDSGTVEAA